MDKMIFKIFIRRAGCSKCHEVLKWCKTFKNKGVQFELYDLDTTDGLGEASYYGVMSVPTIIETDPDDDEINRFTDLKELSQYLEHFSQVLSKN